MVNKFRTFHKHVYCLVGTVRDCLRVGMLTIHITVTTIMHASIITGKPCMYSPPQPSDDTLNTFILPLAQKLPVPYTTVSNLGGSNITCFHTVAHTHTYIQWHINAASPLRVITITMKQKGLQARKNHISKTDVTGSSFSYIPRFLQYSPCG